jgi:hypothetical protein
MQITLTTLASGNWLLYSRTLHSSQARWILQIPQRSTSKVSTTRMMSCVHMAMLLNVTIMKSPRGTQQRAENSIMVGDHLKSPETTALVRLEMPLDRLNTTARIASLRIPTFWRLMVTSHSPQPSGST